MEKRDRRGRIVEYEFDFPNNMTSGEMLASIAAAQVFNRYPGVEETFEPESVEIIRKQDEMLKRMYG